MSTSVQSAKIVAVAAAAPHNTAPPVVSGGARQGETVSTSSGSWNGVTPIGFAYQWQRCDPAGAACVAVAGATGPTYTLAADDVGSTLRALVTATNGAGANSALSLQTAVVTAASGPANTVPPSVSGATSQGSTLTASPGAWTGAAPIAFAYQWLRCDAGGGGCAALGGGTKQTLTLGPGDVGHTMRVLVTATNSVGVASILSGQTAVVSSPSGPVNTSPPRISGTARQGALLTVVKGTWTGSSPITVTYQWLRCDGEGDHCTSIQNANGTTYRLTVSDVNHALRVAVTASNGVGRSTVVSDRTSQVRQSIPQNTALPSIAGAARQGSVLTANPGSWSSFTAVTFSYQWTRCDSAGRVCVPIKGAIGVGRRAYTLTAADVGHRIFVQVKAANDVGPNFVNSPLTPVVTAGTAAPAPVGAAVPVATVAAPDRLLVDRIQFTPSRITGRSQPLVARFHVVEAAGGRPVSGAVVYAVGVPFDRLSAAPEAVTDGNGWATITFRVLPTFELRRGNLVVMFVRARKPGGSVLGGVSTRRLVSVRVG